MVGIAAALAPVFIVILTGFVLKRRRLVPDAFWQPAEQVTFYLFFPSLLVTNIAAAELGSLAVVPMLAAVLLAIAVVVAGCYAVRPLLRLSGPSFTSLLQSSVRPNVYVALAAAAALYGHPGVTLMSLCLAAVIPTVNVISVIVLVRYGSAAAAGPGQWRRLAIPVLSNPLILACLLGLTLNAAGIRLPPPIGPTLEILARASLPIGLLAVGAGIELGAIRAATAAVGTASALKLLALPLLTLLLCLVIGVDGVARAVAALSASVPVSASAYIMARQMGGDRAVMAGAITATTVLAALTMPLVLVAL